MTQDLADEGTLPLLSAGARLRDARIAAGLELEEIAARTRISKRHLAAIESDRYADLASRTYAIGFSKAYARALGLDQEDIAEGVRDEIARQEELQPRLARTEHFAPGDPARVPPSSIAWLAGLGLVVLVGALLFFFRGFLDPSAPLPELVAAPDRKASAAEPARSAAATGAPAVAAGPVQLTATEDVWIKVSDAAGAQLEQKLLKLGESYTVPADAKGPVLDTARPDALRVTVGSRALGALRPSQAIVRDVPLDPASLTGPRTAPSAGASDVPTGRSTAQASTVSGR